MIIYFSGTGNSRFTAKKLSAFLEDEICSINTYFKENKTGDFYSEKPFVIITPTYMSRMPMEVEKFFMEASFSGNKNIYFIFTAKASIGNAHKHCMKIAEKHHLLYRGTQCIEMGGNYVMMYDVPNENEKEEITKKALPHIENIAKTIKENKDLANEGYHGNKAFTSIAPLFNTLMVKDKSFHCEDTCITCGKCAEMCPLNNIHIQDNKAVWSGKCMHCTSCINICPVQAIQYGNITKKRNRYYVD